MNSLLLAAWKRVAILVALAQVSLGSLEAQKFLVVDLDDAGWELIEGAPTPNLDWVADNGRTLNGMWSCPGCSPSRARLNLGQYGVRPGSLVGTIIQAADPHSMPPTADSLPCVVSAAGLRTAKVGKWHLAPNGYLDHPRMAGWQEYAGVFSNLKNRTYFDYAELHNGVQSEIRGEYLTSRETDHALRYVRLGFELISLSYHAVHVPHHVPPRHLYSGPRPKTKLEKALASTQALDHEIGRLIAEAIPAGYTIVIAADNGASSRFGGAKSTLYQGGVSVPCWAIGEHVVPGIDDEMIDWVDVFATAADLLGVPLGEGQAIDSVSFRGVLLGQPSARSWNYSEIWRKNGTDPHTLKGGEWGQAIRNARYKLIRNEGGEGEQFFDLQLDPTEKADLLLGTLTPEQEVALEELRVALNAF